MASTPGARLYLAGQLGDGTPLRGERKQGGPVEGLDAACAGCHRRSGLGTFEGAVRVPPVAWRLLTSSAAQIGADRSLPHVLGFHPERPAYSRASLARALREGVGADGRALSWVMPRFPGLSDAQIDALVAHLQTLAATPPAGAASGELRFALVVTPGTAASLVEAGRAVFERAFAEHNSLNGQTRNGPAVREAGGYDIPRNLHLSVWNLEGPPAGWPAQLERQRRADLPFALLGGTGPGDWSPIDDWCEQRGLPLILPSVEAPTGRDGFYAVHFHRGVRLEAAVIAQELRHRHARPVPVLQAWRAGDSGEAGARALREALGPDWPVSDVVLPAAGTKAPADTVGTQDQAGSPGAAGAPAAVGAASGPSGAVPDAPAAAAVVWLRPADYAAFAPPAAGDEIYASGVLAGDPPHPPAAWGNGVLFTYPWELPQRRRLAMNFPLGWLHAKGMSAVDLRLQTDSWLTSQILEAALADMQDAYYPDYLVERVESLVGHRVSNAHYPHLSLAPGQRFASKGAYLVRQGQDGALIPEGGWRIP